jgi:hypothetical protein
MPSHGASRSSPRSSADPSVPVLLLAGLVATDLVLVAVSVGRLVVAGPSTGDPWLLDTQDGWAERFGYLQQAAIAVALIALALLVRRWIPAAFATVYVGALADDSLRLHSRLGTWLADGPDRHLWFPDGLLGLRASDLGELLVWGLLAVVPLTAAVLLHLRSDAATKRTSRVLAGLLIAYGFFGAVVDQVHDRLRDSSLANAVGVIEDGGELVALSVTVAYAAALLTSARLDRRTPPPDDQPTAGRSPVEPARAA